MYTLSSGVRPVRRALGKWIFLIGGATGMAVVAWAPSPAFASSTGTNTATVSVSVAVRSITVTPAEATFGTCVTAAGGDATGVLTIPGGSCQTGVPGSGVGGITITNGDVAGHIDINGAAAQPSDVTDCYSQVNGETVVNPLCWTLGSPGQDVYLEETATPAPAGQMGDQYQALTTTPTCDDAFSPMGGCTAGDNASQTEYLQIDAPTSSTDTSSTFTITTTWTAVP
jgi:hypothetical protein